MTTEQMVAGRERAFRDINLLHAIKQIGVFCALTSTGMLMEIASKKAEREGLIERDREGVPELFDVPDHVGNFTEGGIYSASSFVIIDVIAQRRTKGDREATTRKAAFGAFCISALVQFGGEKFVGQSWGNTGDTVDAVYGTAYSAAGLTLAARGYNNARRTARRQVGEVYEHEKRIVAEEAARKAERKSQRSAERAAERNEDPSVRAKRKRLKTKRSKRRS